MINIQPVNFQWPITETQEALAIQYHGDITIGQLQDQLLNDQRLGEIVTVASDNQCSQSLDPQMSLEELNIQPDSSLYLFKQVPVQDIVINLFNEGIFVGNYQLSNDTTVQETIALLVQNEIIQPNPLLIKVKDLKGNLLFTDQSLKFNSKPMPEYNLHVVYHELVNLQLGEQATGQEIEINLFNREAVVGNYQLSNDTTVQETIALLVQNEIIQPNPLLIKVKDLKGNLLFTNQSLKFNSKPRPEYNLHVVYHELVNLQLGQQATGQEIIINLFNGGAFVGNYSLSNDTTVQETIALLVQKDILLPILLSIEVKDLQGNLLFTDQSLKFNSKPMPEYNLHVVYHKLINVNNFNEGAYVGQYFIQKYSTIQETIVLLENKLPPANPTSDEMKVTYSQILSTDQSLKLQFKPVPQYGHNNLKSYHLHVYDNQIVFNLIIEGQYVGQYKVSIDVTLKQTIILLVQNNIIPANPILVEMKDTLNKLITSDLSVSFKSKPLSLYNLYVFY